MLPSLVPKMRQFVTGLPQIMPVRTLVAKRALDSTGPIIGVGSFRGLRSVVLKRTMIGQCVLFN
jgi:hypothetical protein